MQHSLKMSLFAITIGIVTTLILYVLVAHSPYFLGIGCALGVYLVKAASLKRAAIHGAVVAIPLAVYINLTGSAGSFTSSTILSKSASIILFVALGGCLGFVYEWIRKQLRKGTIFYS